MYIPFLYWQVTIIYRGIAMNLKYVKFYLEGINKITRNPLDILQLTIIYYRKSALMNLDAITRNMHLYLQASCY